MIGKPRRRGGKTREPAVAQPPVVRNMSAQGQPAARVLDGQPQPFILPDRLDGETFEAWTQRAVEQEQASWAQHVAQAEAVAKAKAEGVVLGAVQAKRAAWVQVERQRVAREKAKAQAILDQVLPLLTPSMRATLATLEKGQA